VKQGYLYAGALVLAVALGGPARAQSTTPAAPAAGSPQNVLQLSGMLADATTCAN
jgi:hypothetical protein